MTVNIKELDIAQLIAEALNRTSEPESVSTGSTAGNRKVIGTVPRHLRHLHILHVDLQREAMAAFFRWIEAVDSHHEEEAAYDKWMETDEKADCVSELFVRAMTQHLPYFEGITILDNWDVVAEPPPRDE